MSTVIDYKQKSDPSSLIIFRNHEIDRYKNLLTRIDLDIRQATKVSQGKIVLDEEKDALFNAFYINRVPVSWQRISYATDMTLTQWSQDLKVRLDFFKSWILRDYAKTYLLSAFMFPQVKE